ncbi:hypothetical protein QFC19_002288 [Naganishia cerealis]|uniref:Uncharacterized protein n=1 Tax=Naganishia cerealis TaxID=610337 RepID=A0ACC2WDE1_9TREE|nr:hypothetical protein QFC19_002288 [Naganishia cerealis]
MASLRASPLIPQHEFNQIRQLAQGVPLPRSRRGLKNIALLCLGPVCLIVFIFYTRTDGPVSERLGASAVEIFVRKGQDGYRAATGSTPSTNYQRPKGKLRLGKEHAVLEDHADFAEGDDEQKSWKDTLVDKFFPDPEAAPIGRETGELEEHTYMDNGLVAVNPRGRHPIYDLLSRSQKQWMEKSARQSSTLRQAVKEYRRRYHRSPPKGFDLWWNYVQENNVQLPDEYDQIHRDLEPFRGMRPAYLHSLQPEWESSPGTYVLECNAPDKPGCHLAQKTFSEAGEERVGLERATAQLGLLKDIEEYLPHLRVTFSGHDGPAQMVGHEYRSSLEDAAEMGECWASACAPHKPIHNAHNPDILPDPQSFFKRPKTFIWDHKASMDPCIHPELTQITGFLAGYGKGPKPQKDLYPILAMCSTPLHSDVLTVAMEAFTEDVGNDPPWEEKTDSRLLWRGSTTGILFSDKVAWNISQRLRLVGQAFQHSGTVPIVQPLGSHTEAIGEPEVAQVGSLNDLLLDIAFVGEPIQCASQEICDELAETYEFRRRQGWDKANNYKYIFDIDGNGWSARFKRLMSTNSLILKNTVFPEWYQDRIQAWVHYVPIKSDLSDLYDVMLFFKGESAIGNAGHDELAREIAMAGKQWSKTYWRREDLIAYQFRYVCWRRYVYTMELISLAIQIVFGICQTDGRRPVSDEL